jgi:hypothetical protein
MNKRFARFSISAAAVLVLAAGCSSGTGSPAGMPGPETAPSSVPSASMTHSPSHSPTTTSTAPDATEAAALRATLTSLLSDHVWLAGNALDTAVQRKGDLKDPQVVGAVKALDANSVALAKRSDRSTPTPRSRSSPPGGNTSVSSSTTPWARPPRTTSGSPRPRPTSIITGPRSAS